MPDEEIAALIEALHALHDALRVHRWPRVTGPTGSPNCIPAAATVMSARGVQRLAGTARTSAAAARGRSASTSVRLPNSRLACGVLRHALGADPVTDRALSLPAQRPERGGVERAPLGGVVRHPAYAVPPCEDQARGPRAPGTTWASTSTTDQWRYSSPRAANATDVESGGPSTARPVSGGGALLVCFRARRVRRVAAQVAGHRDPGSAPAIVSGSSRSTRSAGVPRVPASRRCRLVQHPVAPRGERPRVVCGRRVPRVHQNPKSGNPRPLLLERGHDAPSAHGM